MSPILAMRHAVWLTTSLALVLLPHAERVPWWLTLLVAVLLVWRLYLARTRHALPHRAILILIVLGASAGVYLHYGVLFGRDAGVALLVVMLTLKLLEMRTARDAMLLTFLSYFLVITNFLYSQTIPTALYMLVCVWFITAGMIGIHRSDRRGTTVPQLRTAAALLVQSVPLMLALFVLFPRVQGPLWGMPSDAQRGATGLSDTMAPGSLSSLSLSEAVAFRVVFTSAMPALKHLYWRGPVLWDYDGRTWRAPPFAFGRTPLEPQGTPFTYTVTVEPHGKPWLFAFDIPGAAPPQSMLTADLQLISTRPVTSRVRYEVSSYVEYKYGRNERPGVLQHALDLPAGMNPQTVALAKELKRRHGADRAVVQAVLEMFNQQNFVYTLEPPLLQGDTVDEFLFRTRSGFCEHYSSAFAVLMRAAGIPARVVTGYLGGELNPIGNYLIVRQADAHAWTEIWLPDEGWVRVDPTGAVSPARVESGIQAAAGSTLPLFIRGDIPWLRELRLSWDSLANSWNQWVLGYTPERQRALMTRVGVEDATWRTLAAMLLGVSSVIILVLVIYTVRRLRVRVRDPVRLAYTAFCNKLRNRGLARDPDEGPLAYAQRVTRARPDLEALVQRFIGLYVDLRYGRESEEERITHLQRLAREFQP
jgi:protein-glutamine gamma-glutamyltransferase